MQTATAWARRAILCIASAALLAGVSNGQRTPNSNPMGNSPNPQQRPSDQEKPMEISPGIVERQAKARNDERQKRLVADTEKLLALATQLHEDVGKTDKNVLSLDVIKRADEIEKLARAVKERMKG